MEQEDWASPSSSQGGLQINLPSPGNWGVLDKDYTQTPSAPALNLHTLELLQLPAHVLTLPSAQGPPLLGWLSGCLVTWED